MSQATALGTVAGTSVDPLVGPRGEPVTMSHFSAWEKWNTEKAIGLLEATQTLPGIARAIKSRHRGGSGRAKPNNSWIGARNRSLSRDYLRNLSGF